MRKLLFTAVAVLACIPLRAQYCASGASSTADTDITLVVFNTINNPTSGCATYNNYTAISTTVSIGASYTLQVRAGTCGGEYTKCVRAWIDYNHNNIFDATESIATMGPVSTTTTLSASVTIPAGALAGPTRMRVICQETSTPTAIGPCTAYTWGETEDYTVNLLSPYPDDIGCSAVTSPSSGCGLGSSETIAVTVFNYGTNPAFSFNVNYQVNGGTIVTEPYPGLIMPSASAPFTFATLADMSLPGAYNIVTWTSWVLDGTALDDTAKKSVTSIPTVTSYPYIESFETGTGGWVDGGTNETWNWGTPAKSVITGCGDGVFCWCNGGLGTTDYLNNDNSFVIGPCFDFSTLVDPWVSLRLWWDTEASWDGANLQASTDGGSTWTTIGAVGDPYNWYNDASLFPGPGGATFGWAGTTFSGGSPGWVRAAHRLTGLGGLSAVRLRIAFASDGSVVYDGVAFDDIRVGEGVHIDLGPDQLICGGDTTWLTPGPGYVDYYWSGGDTNAIHPVFLGTTGTIMVSVMDTNGFPGTDTIKVSISNPVVSLGPDTTTCPGDTLILDAGNPVGATFDWSDGTTTQFDTIVAPGVYTVIVTDSVGCQRSDTLVWDWFVPPTLDLGPDTLVCFNEPVLLDAGSGPPGTSYDWSTGAGTQVLIVTAPGTYSAVVITPGGCAATDTVSVGMLPQPVAYLGPDHTECGPFTLDASNPGATFNWSTGATTQAVNLTGPGIYSVTVTNSFGCTDVDTINIIFGTVPVVDIGNDTILCNSAVVTLDAGNPGLTYLWSTGATTQTITVGVPAIYFVDVLHPSGCIGSDTMEVTTSAVSLSLGPDRAFCQNEGTILDAGNPAASHLWNTGETTQTIYVTTPGTYSVQVVDGSGCIATDNINLTLAPAITAAFTAPATGTLFSPVNFTDGSSPGPVSWFWDFDDGSTSTVPNPTHTFLAFGVYNVMLVASNGSCKDTTYQDININTYIGVDESMFARSIEVFPNPSTGEFNVNMELIDVSGVRLTVFDVTGRAVYTDGREHVITWNSQIDLTQQAKGLYVLEIDVAGMKSYRKLIVAR